MEFSEVAHRELASLVDAPPIDLQPSSVRWGGSWHCPADATLMDEAKGVVRCAACGRSLAPKLIYRLVEFHVHPR